MQNTDVSKKVNLSICEAIISWHQDVKWLLIDFHITKAGIHFFVVKSQNLRSAKYSNEDRNKAKCNIVAAKHRNIYNTVDLLL